MTDIATLTANANAAGFERGSQVTLQTVMAWLDARGVPIIAEALSVASGSGELEQFRPDLLRPAPVDPSTFEPGPARPQMTHEQARGSGYTGNQCTHCSSMRMTISGHCEKCEDCGESSGCS